MQNTMFVGLDVHKATISVAIAHGARDGEVRHWGTIPNRADHVRRLAEKFGSDGRQLYFCLRGETWGYGLHRQLTELGHDCMVVAPSLIPVKAGDRVKTDRRDALMLAKLHRAGELTAVWVPDRAHEAMRDLIRARATAVSVAGKARQHLQGVLASAWPDPSGKEGLEEGLSSLAVDSWLRQRTLAHFADESWPTQCALFMSGFGCRQGFF